MKNIALMIYSLKGGGAERVVSQLSQELSKKYNLYLFVFDSEDVAYPYGGNLIDINVKSYRNFFGKMINVIRRTYRVKKLKKQYNIQTSISFMNSANIVNILSRRKDKVIISIHSNLSKRSKGFYGKLSKKRIKYMYTKADSIITVSKGVAKDLINVYGLDKELVNCIYNPVNIKEIQKLSQESIPEYGLLKDSQFTITNMGRLTNAKGQWHLIRALNYVKKEIQDVKLLILGQGELENYLKYLVNKLNLKDNVVFLGYQKNPFKYMNKSDVFVFSSLYEGFGNALIEAMACGIPVISTDCRSGPRELLAPDTDVEYTSPNIEYCEYGIIVPVCDGNYYDYDVPLTREEKILAKSIIELYKDEKVREYYSHKGRERAKDFDITNIVEEWENLL